MEELMHSEQIDMEDSKRNNFKISADYLAALPEDYEGFDMEQYFVNLGVEIHKVEYCLVTSCGTVACALGHCPTAGVIPKPGIGWDQYCRVNFCSVISREFDWCFGGSWALTDNTPHGAAKRIYWMLEHGVPDDHSAQMNGKAPLCYMEN